MTGVVVAGAGCVVGGAGLVLVELAGLPPKAVINALADSGARTALGAVTSLASIAGLL